MNHKVKALVPVEKKTFFGTRKTVYEKRTILVDSKTYREMKKREKAKPYSVTEMMLYDELWGD